MASMQQKFISRSSEGWKVHGQGTGIFGLRGPSSWFPVVSFLLYLHMVGREQENSLGSFYECTNPIHEHANLMT